MRQFLQNCQRIPRYSEYAVYVADLKYLQTWLIPSKTWTTRSRQHLFSTMVWRPYHHVQYFGVCVCVFVWVCACVCLCLCVRKKARVLECACLWEKKSLRASVCVCVCQHVFYDIVSVCTGDVMYACVCVCPGVFVCVLVCVLESVSIGMCMCIRICMCVCGWVESV